MSTPTIANQDLRSDDLADAIAGFELSERSPLVAVAMAMGIAGTILATANDVGVSWMLLFFCACAVEEEVRNFNVPVRLSIVALVGQLAWVAYSADAPAFGASLGGAALAPIVMLPGIALGFVRPGALWAGAAIGAIMGLSAMAFVMLLATAIALPLGLSLGLFNANLKTVPVVSLIAIGAAIYPLL